MGLGGRNKVSEQAVEALTQAKNNQLELNWLRKQVTRQRQLIRAQWELIKDRLNLTDEELASMVDQLEAVEKVIPRVAELCPQCGRSLQENRSQCIYCNYEVKRRELF